MLLEHRPPLVRLHTHCDRYGLQRGDPRPDGRWRAIVEWVNARLDQVHIAPMEVGIDQQRRLEEGRTTRGLGEAAALETLERVLSADTEAEPQLLFVDSYIMRRDITADLLPSERYRNSEHPRWEPFLRIDVASDGAKPMSDSHGERAWSRVTIHL